MIRCVTQLLFGVLLVSTVHSAFAQDSGNKEAEPIAFVWQKSCTAPQSPPLLAIRVLANGAVTYEGSPLVKENGLLELPVSAQAVARLRRLAERALAESETERTSTPLPTDYCVYVRFADRPEKGLLISRSVSGSRMALVQSLERELHLKDHMCPLPGGGYTTPFYAPNFCDESVFTAAFPDDKDCFSAHVVDVYSNGLVHYFAQESKAGPPRVRKNIGDQFYTIGKRDLRELYEAVRGLTVVPTTLEPPPTRRNGKPLDSRGTASELSEFRQELSRHIPIRWFDVPDPVLVCSSRVQGGVTVHDTAGPRLLNAK